MNAFKHSKNLLNNALISIASTDSTSSTLKGHSSTFNGVCIKICNCFLDKCYCF